MKLAEDTNDYEFEKFLLKQDFVTEGDLERARKLQQETGERFIHALYRLSLIRGSVLANAVSDFYNIPVLRENEWPEEIVFHNRLSLDFLREYKICPVTETDDAVILAVSDPGDTYAINAVKLALARKTVLRIASLEDIDLAIGKTQKEQGDKNVWTGNNEIPEGTDEVQHLRDIALGTPVVRFVNQLLLDAVRSRATDIHVEPFDNHLSLRLRIDGILHQIESPPQHMAKAIVSRIKILSELNIAERRLPQDGRARIRIENQKLDLRIATIPTIYGEAVAIRILDNIRRVLDFSRLGFGRKDERIIKRQLQAPYGMFVVTGPTGSGKTTTIATALNLLNDSKRKILTIEDPIEYELAGVNQTAVRPSIGLTFAAALRSFLRHDPDIIMVGEMRDGETASIGINSALTGHLVLTTLHTNSAAGTIPRMLDMGIDAYLLASSLRCLVGQRLVRRLCDNCKQSCQGTLDLPAGNTVLRDRLHTEKVTLWRACGCDRCFNTGYSDRIVLSETIEINEEIQSLIKPETSAADIEICARNQGMTTMLEDGYAKCIEGITTIEEVRRVVIDI